MPPPARRSPRPADARGQAAVELCAVLPLIAVLLAALRQAALAGHAPWAASAAARAAARAHAVGADARGAALRHLPESLERAVAVTSGDDGAVTVRVRVPALPGLPSPGRAASTSRFSPQS